MNEEQIFKGFRWGIIFFRVATGSFISSFIISLIYPDISLADNIMDFSEFLVPNAIALIILFRGDLDKKKGYFGTLIQILNPFNNPTFVPDETQMKK
ncbi:MAG: hypothetical protein Q8Q01_05470 [archaeon]|nr:hypothetical protein [archaeon]